MRFLSRPGTRILISILVAAAMFFVPNVGATAATCVGLYHSGQGSNSQFGGISAHITTASQPYVFVTNAHVVQWVGSVDLSHSCNGLSACWNQTGALTGTVGYAGHYVSNMGIVAYYESNNPQVYGIWQYPAVGAGVGITVVYNTFATGAVDGDGRPIWQQYAHRIGYTPQSLGIGTAFQTSLTMDVMFEAYAVAGDRSALRYSNPARSIS